MGRVIAVPVALIAVVAGFSLSACGTPGPAHSAPKVAAHFDGPVYESIPELSAAADVVVSGRVMKIRSRTTEADLQGVAMLGSGKGLPLALYEVRVDKTHKGLSKNSILVTRIDTRRLATDDQTMFSVGRDMMLFLRNTGFVRYGLPIYSVVGMDQGRLEIVSGKLRSVPTSADEQRQQLGNGLTVGEVVAQID